jgi:hypothetical protein
LSELYHQHEKTLAGVEEQYRLLTMLFERQYKRYSDGPKMIGKQAQAFADHGQSLSGYKKELDRVMKALTDHKKELDRHAQDLFANDAPPGTRPVCFAVGTPHPRGSKGWGSRERAVVRQWEKLNPVGAL